MGIDVRKFIDVNITHSNVPSVLNARDTAVLVTSEGTASTVKLLASKSEWDEYKEGKVFTNTEPYVDIFFANGGAKLLLVEASDTTVVSTLQDNYIVVVVVGLTLNNAKTLAVSLDSSSIGLHRKLLVVRAVNSDISSDPLVSGLKSLIVKYSETVGSEMSVAAYLTRIKLDGTDTVHDYAFTSETILADTSVVVDDALFDTLQGYNFNFNLDIAGATRNIGGNTTAGLSLVNEFMLIVLHQTMTEQLLALLVTKIKGNKALAAIRTVLSQELNRYVQNGYLSTDKRWLNEDWTAVHNGVEYTIIAKNTPLSLGYYVQVLPWSSLTAQEKAADQAPPIYVVLADAFGIRKLTLVGEVI